MKTLAALAFALLALVTFAASPAQAETAPEPALPAADPAGICEPAPVFQINPCFAACLAIREECDAGCSTTQCHRECRDSAIECMSHC